MHPGGDDAGAGLRLTDLIGAPVLDTDGTRAGRVRDVLAALTGAYPDVTALIVRPHRASRGTTVRVPLALTSDLGRGAVVLRGPLPATGDERRPHELSLGRDVLDVQIVDVDERRVARVGDVRLAWTGDELQVVAVDAGWRAILRRLGLRRLAMRASHDAIEWSALHVAAGRAHALQLAEPSAAVQRLDPQGLAELVARLPRASGAALLRELPADRASATLAAVHPDLGADLVDALPLARAAELLADLPEHQAAAALRGTSAERRAALAGALAFDSARLARLHAAIAAAQPAAPSEPRPPRRYWNMLRRHGRPRR